jgi:chromosome segregation ATPase
MAQVATAPPLPLSALTSVPRRLAAIVERAMRRDPLERYPSATAFADDLDAWCADRPTSLDRGLARPGVHLYRERGRALLVAALGVVTLGSSAVVARNAAEIDRQQADLAAAGQALRELETSRDRLATQLRGTRESLEVTRSELSEKTHRLDQQQEALGVAIAEVDRLAVDLDARSGDLETRNLELTLADARIQAMEDDIDALRRDLAAMTNVAAGMEVDLSSTRGRLANVAADLDRTRSELVDELGRSATLDRSLADAVNDADAQRRRAAAAEERTVDLERQRTTLQATVQTVSARVAALEAELALLRPQ